MAQVTPEDLERYGMIPELIGRLPVIATLNQLSEDDLARILTEPKDALTKQYQVLFHYDGAKLEFTDGAIREIARRAKARGTGARALRSIMESLMLDIMYELPDRAAGPDLHDHRQGRPGRGVALQPERGLTRPGQTGDG